MSGGDELSENHSETFCAFVNVSQAGVGAIIRSVLEECMKDPHGFVDRENETRT